MNLWEHQKQAIEKARSHRDYALFFEQGTGKTATAIHILRDRFNEKSRIRKTLIICPLIVVKNWAKEIQMWSKIPSHRVFAMNNSGKKRQLELDKAIDRENIIILNYEAFDSKVVKEKIQAWKPEIMILDESHRVKNYKSKRAKTIYGLAKTASHRYLLSGTPILNSELDIFSQFRIMDLGQTFTDNYFIFRNRYFYDKNAAWSSRANHFPDFQPIKATYNDLMEKIRSKSIRVLKENCLDLPPMVEKIIEVDLSSEQRKHYESMKKDFITFLENKEEISASVAQQAVTKALRLQQIITGFIKTEDGREVEFKKVPRLDALKDLLEDIAPAEKTIVWSSFIKNYSQIEQVCDKLKMPYVKLVGGMTQRERENAIEQFQNNPEIRIMIANRAAAGIGVNLTAASCSIVYSRNFSLEEEEQSKARNYRGGSEIHDKITKIDLCAKQTIDEHVLKNLANKKKIGDTILEIKNAL